jgi:hypothetical protein
MSNGLWWDYVLTKFHKNPLIGLKVIIEVSADYLPSYTESRVKIVSQIWRADVEEGALGPQLQLSAGETNEKWPFLYLRYTLPS